MTVPITRSLNPAIRDVTRGLAAARDAQIRRAVAMVDAMPVRGDADQIIAPLRGRLARLRPPRPLRFARLLFLPLDPLIVPATRWRPGQPVLPRTVIPVLAEAVSSLLGDAARAIHATIEGRTTEDLDVVESAGRDLWPRAAGVLLSCPVPADWAATGLGVAVFPALARRIGALLSQAVPLSRMLANAAEGLVPPEPVDLQALMSGAAVHDPEVHPAMIALLLARIPEAAPALAKAAAALVQSGEALPRDAEEQAADVLLEQLEAPGAAEGQLGGQDLMAAGAAVRRLTGLLGALEREPMPPGRRERTNGLRRRIRAGCLSLFSERLTTDLLEPLQAAGGPEDAWAYEGAARGLRALETEARRAGGDAVYDQLLHQAAETVRSVAASGALGWAGGLRLLEILAGADEALASFGEEAEAEPRVPVHGV